MERIEELGCEGLLGRQFATLSQGEQQRILIARALMASLDILILDEPCTGLDLLAREQLLAKIHQLTQEPNSPTLIYVTHHIEEILPGFTHTLLLKQGKVYDAGATSEIVRTETLSEFFETPIEVHQQGRRKWVMLHNKEFV
nr:ATP-binding cassette domain-containing protein [Ectobacillus panaciterrae]